MINSIFAKELTRIFIALVFFLLIGRITGNWLASLSLVLFVYIVWLYSKLYQLNKWIESGLLESKRPAADGAWERLIFLIHQEDKKSKNRKSKTNTLLKHFQGIVRGLPFATIVLNDMNEIEWANTMSAELLQIKPKTDRGQRIDNLIRDPKFHSMLLNKTENEIEITSPFSKEVTLSLRTLPFQTNSTLLVVRDISERTRLDWWIDLIEININNLAAVPSIVFGILGLAVYINLFGVPRSAPLVGGLVLTLMTLPTIIISTRAALKSVPPSIREAALSIGASKMQVITHHVLPLAMPGILTGSIIGMAQALGETAPLLMIGMVAFVADIPQSILDPATVLPVQVFIWSDSPERGFIALTSAAIVTLLVFLFFMNLIAIVLRKKFETRW